MMEILPSFNNLGRRPRLIPLIRSLEGASHNDISRTLCSIVRRQLQPLRQACASQQRAISPPVRKSRSRHQGSKRLDATIGWRTTWRQAFSRELGVSAELQTALFSISTRRGEHRHWRRLKHARSIRGLRRGNVLREIYN
jgi:hypothetical protein